MSRPGLHPDTRSFLGVLRRPEVRGKIRAAPDRTLLYCGRGLTKPAWKEISEFKRSHPEYRDLETLPDVLARTPAPGTPYPTLLAYIQALDVRLPWQPDGFVLWRAVSGIFAANAIGKVSFQIGSGVTAVNKVFAATELPVLRRNPRVDPVSKDLLEYYGRCIARGQPDINVGYMA